MASITQQPDLPIAAAAAGDEEAFVTVVRRMMPLIRSALRRWELAESEDDARQECLLALLAAVRTFRPDGGASFTTYASTCIHHRLVSYTRRQQTHNTVEQPLEEDESLPDAAEADPAQQVQEQEELLLLQSRLAERLTPLEYRVLCARLSDCSYDEIAARLGINKKAVDNAVQRLRRKLTDES